MEKTKICRAAALILALICISTFFAFPASATASEASVALSVTVRTVGQAPGEAYSVRLSSVGEAKSVFHLELAAGTASFSPIVYRTAGVWRYTLSQTAGEYPGAHYDESVYAVTVTVTNTEGGLKPTVVIKKDGVKQEAAEFVNIYDSSPGILDGNDTPGTDVDPPPEEPPAEEPPIVDLPPEIPEEPPVSDSSQPGGFIHTGQRNLPVLLFFCVGIALIAIGAAVIVSGNKAGGKDRRR